MPERRDFTQFESGTAQVQIMDQTGRSIDQDAQSIRDARIVFRQSDADGI